MPDSVLTNQADKLLLPGYALLLQTRSQETPRSSRKFCVCSQISLLISSAQRKLQKVLV